MSSLGFLIIGNDFKYVENIFLIGEIGLWLSSFLTIYTGYIYFKNSRNLFKEWKKKYSVFVDGVGQVKLI